MARFSRLTVASICGVPIIFAGFALRGDEKQPAAKAAVQTASEPPAETPLAAPFKLTKQEQAEVDRALDGWKQATSQIKTYECNFTHWVYDSTFFPPPAPGKELAARSVARGEFKYAAPDKWLINETSFQTWTLDSSTHELRKTTLKHGDHRARDGNVFYEFDHERKLITKTVLPPNTNHRAPSCGWEWLDRAFDRFAKSYVDCPPFLICLRSDRFRDRYYARIITPQGQRDEIWLELIPRFEDEAANTAKIEVILNAKQMLPVAARMCISQNDFEVYQFANQAPNEMVAPFAPDTFVPTGYKVIENNPAPPEPSKSH